jgi:hypothetical protein
MNHPKHEGPSAETLAAEAALVDRFTSAEAVTRRLGFNLQAGKGPKNGSRAKAEARMQQKTTDSYAHKGKPQVWGA